MKNITKIFAIALVALGFSTSALAQNNTATANANATIAATLTIEKATTDGDMNFGTVYSSSASKQLTLGTDGGRSGSAGFNATTPANAAHFTVTGTAAALYTITTIAPIYVSSIGAVDMVVDAFTTNPALTGGVLSGTTGVGTQTIAVGATLNLNANQKTGFYTSTTPFTVTVNYQ